MNKTDITKIKKELEPYKRFLYTAYNAQYVYGMTINDAEKVFDVYNKMFNTNEKSFSCGHCRIRICSALYKKIYVTENGRRKRT